MGLKDIHHLLEHHKAALADTLAFIGVPRHTIEQEVVHYRDVCYTTTRAAPEGRHHHPICLPDRGLLGTEHDPEGVEASLCKVADVIKWLSRHREAGAQADVG